MPASGSLTLGKDERLCGKTLTEKLFKGGGSRSMAAFPLRLVYMRLEQGADGVPVKILVSVPKRCFKRAVKRNRVKRQVREAYRQNKKILYDRLESNADMGLAVAFIWLDDKLWSSADVEKRVVNLMRRLAEKL